MNPLVKSSQQRFRYLYFLLLLSSCCPVEEAKAQIYANKNAAKFMLGAGILGGLALFAKGYHLGSIGNDEYTNPYTTYIPVNGYDGNTRIVHQSSYGYHPPYLPTHHHGHSSQHLLKPVVLSSSYGPYKVVLPPQRVVQKNPRGTVFVTNHIHNYHNRGLLRH